MLSLRSELRSPPYTKSSARSTAPRAGSLAMAPPAPPIRPRSPAGSPPRTSRQRSKAGSSGTAVSSGDAIALLPAAQQIADHGVGREELVALVLVNVEGGQVVGAIGSDDDRQC